jgi:hypothetical protein
MINLGTYRKELSINLRSIFEDVQRVADICCEYSPGVRHKDRETDLSVRFRGEVHQLAVVLQYEDIINQSFLSFDAISEEVKKITTGKIKMTFEEYEKLSGMIKAVVENTVSLITGSLENIDNRLGRLGDLVAGDENLLTSAMECNKIIDNLRVRINMLIDRVGKDGSPVFREEIPICNAGDGFGLRKDTVVKRLSKSFRVVEHKQILNCFFPGESAPGEAGVLEIF